MDENFPWSKICDAHSHLQNDVKNHSRIGELKTSRICMMGYKFEDLDVVSKLSKDFPDKIIPSFGYHPWFAHLLSLGEFTSDPHAHYCSILNGSVSKKNTSSTTEDNNLDTLISSLPPPIPYSSWHGKLESLIESHPGALVGEIGLDKSAKLTLPSSPAKHKRAVSLHCVQSTGQIMQLLDRKVLDKQPLPPRICMHSYGGSVDTIKALTETQPKKKKKLPVQVYFSFSIVINERYSRLPDLIKAVPEDRLLIESDFHSPVGLDDLMERIVKLVSNVKGWTPEFTVEKCKENFSRFIGESQ
ncbi:10396_t:CDS:2 [Acaulospora morrowiae]|uniref:10396_t:CDS:1 n=1 Tax=Acaulospora morrowiae TaxID=94023 RepID=A0A9N9N9G7_9GLOM|nr:10396_t:CDS:2 [Acaulospora morrowiae]